MRSTGQTGLKSTVPRTAATAAAGVVVDVATAPAGAVVEVVAGTTVLGPPPSVPDVGTIVVGRAWPSDRTADSGLPQAVATANVMTTAPSPRRTRGECTSPV
jgi:hypothetical protein